MWKGVYRNDLLINLIYIWCDFEFIWLNANTVWGMHSESVFNYMLETSKILKIVFIALYIWHPLHIMFIFKYDTHCAFCIARCGHMLKISPLLWILDKEGVQKWRWLEFHLFPSFNNCQGRRYDVLTLIYIIFRIWVQKW